MLQTLASSLHLHLHVFLVSLVFDIRLNILTFKFFTTSGTHIFAYGSLILLQLPQYLLVLILRIKYRLITININNFWFYFTFLIIHWNTTQLICTCTDLHMITLLTCQKRFFNKSKHFYIISYYSFSLNAYEWLKNRQLQ